MATVPSLNDHGSSGQEVQTSSTSAAEESTAPSHGALPFIFGQLIAFVVAAMNVTSFTLVQRFGVETQFFQLFWVYLLLSTNLLIGWKSADTDLVPTQEEGTRDSVTESTTYHLPLIPGNRRLLIPWWIYLLMSLLDVVPNYLTLASFRFTSLTSTTLLGSLTVPSTMFFSRIFLAKRFGLHQFAGVLLCVIGGALTVYQDAGSYASTNSSVGDLFAITAAIIYGLGDAVAEYSVKRIDRFEYLGMLGLFGMVLTSISIPLTELQALSSLLVNPHNRWSLTLLFFVYVASVCIYYVASARFLVSSDATLLNLSLQSVNLWAVGFTWLTSTASLPSPLFFVALVLVVVGVCLYETGSHKYCWGGDGRARSRSESSEAEMVSNLQQPRAYDTLCIHNTELLVLA